MGKVLRTVGAAGLVVYLGGACSSPSSERATEPKVTAPSERAAPDPTTSPEQAIEDRAIEMWKKATDELRGKVEDGSPANLMVAQDICLYWPAHDGYFTVVKNPVFYPYDVDNEQLTMLAFVYSPPGEQPVLMNGPFEYAKIDAFGNPIPETIMSSMGQVKFQSGITPLITDSEVTASLGRDEQSEWILDGNGQKIAHTFLVSPSELSARLTELCGTDFSKVVQAA